MRTAAALLCWALLAPAQEPGVVPLGPGIKPPKLKERRDAPYTRAAWRARVQGTVLLSLVVDEHGRPAQIEVTSPLGFGLDHSAVRAVAGWRYSPATRDEQPIAVRIDQPVTFRFRGAYFDSKGEKRRVTFNKIINEFSKTTPPYPPDRIEELGRLAEQKFLPAQTVYGLLLVNGDGVTKDPARGWEYIRKAADKRYAPALWLLGSGLLSGEAGATNPEQGRQLIWDASVLGSVEAQFFEGDSYEWGKGVPADEDRARRQFRLCAARGVPKCQHRLAVLLLKPERPERDRVQGLVWLQLAAESGFPESQARLRLLLSQFSPEQLTAAQEFRRKLFEGR